MSGSDIGLQKLLLEPQRLALEAERVNGELEVLVTENYHVFVENLTCSMHLQREVRNHCIIFDCHVGLGLTLFLIE